jgi:hypothetical protein
MNISHLNVGIIHSLIGKNDGVSIVIDQTVNAMVKDMGINLGNIFFLAAHTSPRFNAETNEILWHKNDIHKKVLQFFSTNPPDGLDNEIHEQALYAKSVIKNFVDKNNIDLLIAHNTSHPYNFITAVGLGYYLEELRSQGFVWPNVLVWWHDSYFERDRFKNPNPVIEKYLKYLPGTEIDGVAFINNDQPELAKKYFKRYNLNNFDRFFRERAIVVPNTSDIPWNWESQSWNSDKIIHPPQDHYNDSLFKDIGLECELDKRGFTIDNTVLLLQHTRVVPRKKIEVAIDFAFELEKKYINDGVKKCIAIIVSGHSGDEMEEYKQSLIQYYQSRLNVDSDSNVIIVFGENRILSHRDIIVDKKYYKFAEIPSVIAASGGLGTYFSEVEGFGNNLLEMISLGLPALINRYDVFRSDIEQYGFKLPYIDEVILTPELIEEGYRLLTDIEYRNQVVHHNLKVLKEKLDHKIIADKIQPLILNMFTRTLN